VDNTLYCVLLMSFTIYCVHYVMKIDRLHPYVRERGFPTNAHCEFSSRSINALSRFAVPIIYGTRAEFTGAYIEKVYLLLPLNKYL